MPCAAATSAASALLPLLFPCIWLAAVWSLMRKQMGGATGSVGKKGSAMRLSADDLSFEDVAGIDTVCPQRGSNPRRWGPAQD